MTDGAVADPATGLAELRGLLDVLPAPLLATLAEAADDTARALAAGHTAWFLGNGGSAAQAEHLAAELVGRFLHERPPFRAAALTSSGTLLSALANDYPPEELFARQVAGLVEEGDVVMGISTSGRSPNVLHALDEARRRGALCIGLTGAFSGDMEPRCDWVLPVPSRSVPRLQEVHLLLGHLFCQRVEARLRAPSRGEGAA